LAADRLSARGPRWVCYRAPRFRGGASAPFRRGPAVPVGSRSDREGSGNLTVSPECGGGTRWSHPSAPPRTRTGRVAPPCQPPQQMVRLVFRPYTQVRKAICTSAHLRASTRVSSGFALLRHSSPSFGSQQTCSHSNLSQKIMVGRWCRHRPSHQSGYLRFMGLPPTSSHACYTPWSVFQDG
jgi:hypothetical protein